MVKQYVAVVLLTISSKNSLKKCVLSLFLKDCKFVSSRRLSGRSFQIQGAVTLNEHSANVLFFTNGTTTLVGTVP